jgi:CBS domain containing-hemolysin-like protein
MDEADSPHPSILQRLRQVFSRRVIAQPEDLEREIQHILDEGQERGLITRQEGQLIESIFDFRDTLVREIMVPRLEMVGVELHTPVESIISLVLTCGHSRLPVFTGDIDHITGILLAKDLLVFWQTPDDTWDLQRVLRPAYFVPESKKISDLLRDLVERKTQIAIVIDEYGGTAGLITLEDILEEIVGEIYDEYDRMEPRLLPQEDGSVLVDARLDVEELMEHFDLPRPEGKFESVGGLLIHVLGRVP